MAMVIVLDAASQMQAFPVKQLNWTTQDDLIQATEGSGIVTAIIKTIYGSLQIEQVFVDLMQCGKLLQVALTAAGLNGCSVPILKALSGYQTLCNNSVVTTGSFVTSCIAALKAHKMIVMAFEKGKGDLGIKQFEKCGKLAEDMAALSLVLEEEAEKLVADTENGLLQTKLAVEEKIRQAKVKRAEQETRVRDLQAAKEAQADEERKMAALAKEAQAEAYQAAQAVRDSAHSEKNAQREAEKPTVLGQFSKAVAYVAAPVTAPIGAVGRALGLKEEPAAPAPVAVAEVSPPSEDKAAEQFREKMFKAMEEQKKIMEDKREANVDLARQLETISQYSEQEHSLNMSVELLGTCISTLGKIVTTFKDVRMFWQQVARHCKHLVALKDDVNDMWECCEGFDNDVKNSVMQSAVSWAALGRVNYEAHVAMVKSKEVTDNIMCKLPEGESTKNEIEMLVANLTSSLDKSNENLVMIEDALDKGEV